MLCCSTSSVGFGSSKLVLRVMQVVADSELLSKSKRRFQELLPKASHLYYIDHSHYPLMLFHTNSPCLSLLAGRAEASRARGRLPTSNAPQVSCGTPGHHGVLCHPRPRSIRHIACHATEYYVTLDLGLTATLKPPLRYLTLDVFMTRYTSLAEVVQDGRALIQGEVIQRAMI